MHKGTYFALAAIAVVGGFGLGQSCKSERGEQPASAGSPSAPAAAPIAR